MLHGVVVISLCSPVFTQIFHQRLCEHTTDPRLPPLGFLKKTSGDGTFTVMYLCVARKPAP